MKFRSKVRYDHKASSRCISEPTGFLFPFEIMTKPNIEIIINIIFSDEQSKNH